MTTNHQLPSDRSKLDKAMTTEQFHQIVDAILAGKYSWACVLILRYAGYNPLHYIPYTTYIRLVKDNQREESQQRDRASKPMTDLNYLEKLEEGSKTIRGGNGAISHCYSLEFRDRDRQKIFLPNW